MSPKKWFPLTLAAALAAPCLAGGQDAEPFETLTFRSLDGLEITADLYDAHEDPKTPFIVLAHQAGWSRGEYREIAPWLVGLGFDVLALDQRSGDGFEGVVNETAKRARDRDLGRTYLDAKQDLVAALRFARKKGLARGPLLLWGSSYSAALALVVASEEPDLVDGVLSFSPGEYFVRLGKDPDWVTRAASRIRCPAFLTCARAEAKRVRPIFEAIPGEEKTLFLPETPGNHGSRALFERFPDHGAYREAVVGFLSRFIEEDPTAKKATDGGDGGHSGGG